MSGLYDDDETVPEYWRPRPDPPTPADTTRIVPVPPFAPAQPLGQTPPLGQTRPSGQARPPRSAERPECPERRFPAAAAGLLAAVAVVIGVAIGHDVWSASTPAAMIAQNGAVTPSGNAAGGPASSGVGVGGQSGSGSGSSASGSGSGGSGSGSGGSNGPVGGSATSSNAPLDVASIAAKVGPALVDINSTFGYEDAKGAGTGIVLTSDGEILTNNHVINLASSISVTDVGNGKTYPATVVGYDKTRDIAVLKLTGASGLQTAKIGDSSTALVGDSVVGIGNAGGTGGTPSTAAGSITALNRSITAGDSLDGTSERLAGLIEVAADVQPGDSGGPLVNNSGEIIGVDTAASEGFSFRGAAASQGFAIPINQALAIASQIESGQGSATVHVGPTAFLGVYIAGGSSQAGGGGGGGYAGAGGYGSGSTTVGAQVAGVAAGGAAAKAGLGSGDVITSLNGQTVDSASTLTKLIVGLTPGQTVSIGWDDANGQSHTATVDLGTGPPA